MGRWAWNLREKADFQPVAAAAREGHRANGANSHHVIVYERPTVLSDCGAETEAKRDRTPASEEMYLPELQVIEIVPVPKTNYVPPFPLP